MGLKRELGLFQTVAYGVGIILGAGIYALIGQAAGMAGNAVWMSFVIAAFIASFTGLSYAELCSVFSKDAAEYLYVKKAFGNELLSFLTGWSIVLTGVVGAAAVALGFGGYFSAMFGTPIIVVGVSVLILFSLLNFYGIKMSTGINIIFTLIEAGGILLIIALGLGHIGSVNYLESTGTAGIFSAAALIFFAYIGFESIVKMGEETKSPRKILPTALILSIVITTILYILMSLSVVSIMPWEELAKSSAPVADVAARAMGGQAYLMLSVIALFATGNTVLILLIATSRMIYGMTKEHVLPKPFGYVHKTRNTPWVSIFFVMFVSMLFTLIGNIKTVANITNFSVFLVFIMVNLSLIKLRYRKGFKPRFRSPINIGRFPVLAALGIAVSLLMLLQFSTIVVAYGLGILLAGAIVYKLID
ncbi:MAG: amino acid transporter [Candidatus Aenigmarchaeota archaeon ex4484_14]|nr:MAG: amino acid transporter [Candidatus Aenigmarchaeota archaeon ex4484_14]